LPKVFAKMKRFKRVADLPSMLVGVQGLASSPKVNPLRAFRCRPASAPARSSDPFAADPLTVPVCAAATLQSVPEAEGQALCERTEHCLAHVSADPFAGTNVNRLFHDMIHAVVEFVLPQHEDRVGTLFGGIGSPLRSTSKDSIAAPVATHRSKVP
jgi:hypothetical protein